MCVDMVVQWLIIRPGVIYRSSSTPCAYLKPPEALRTHDLKFVLQSISAVTLKSSDHIASEVKKKKEIYFALNCK